MFEENQSISFSILTILHHITTLLSRPCRLNFDGESQINGPHLICVTRDEISIVDRHQSPAYRALGRLILLGKYVFLIIAKTQMIQNV